MNLSTCPDQQQLTDYLLGKLDEPKAAAISQHFQQCPRCEVEAVTLDGVSDTVIQQIRQSPGKDPYSSEPELRQMLRDLGRFSVDQKPVDQKPADQIPSEPEEDLGQLRDYRLLSKIGAGGMGTVYKALHTKLDKIVALKVLAPEKMKNSASVERFQREMKAVGKLDHPNIVRASDAGEVDGAHFLVMELVDGSDVARLVKRLGRLPIAEACEIVRQAALGLQHAADHQLVHRDIKPSNLMVTRGGQVKVLDLGLARLEQDSTEPEQLTESGQVMGTIAYMAPEQAGDSHAIDIRADIYSLGATLFKLLCGRAALESKKHDTLIKKLAALANIDPPALETLREDLPQELTDLVGQMLRKNPEERPSSPAEVAEALTPFCGASDLSALVNSADEATIETTLSIDLPKDAAAMAAPTEIPLTAQVSIKTQPLQRRGKRGSRRLVAIALTGLAVVMAGVMVVTLSTNNGQVVIQYAEDEDIQLIIKRGGEVVQRLELSQDETVKTLRAGQYEVELRGVNSDLLKIDNDHFVLARGDKTLVKIYRKDPPAAAPSVVASSDSDSSDVVEKPHQAERKPMWLPEDGPLDLLPLVDVDRDSFQTRNSGWEPDVWWHKRGEELRFRTGKGMTWPQLTLSAEPRGAYEMEVTLTLNRSFACFYLPVGKRGVYLFLEKYNDLGAGRAYFLMIDGHPLSVVAFESLLTPNQTLLIKVVPEGDRVYIEARLGDRRLTSWEGEIASLSVPELWSPLNSAAVGLACHIESELTFHSVRLRMLDGVALLATEPLHAAETERGVSSVAFTPDGQRLITGGPLEVRDPQTLEISDSVFLWDRQTPHPFVALTGDGKTMVAAGGANITVVDMKRYTVRSHLFLKDNDHSQAITISPDGGQLAVETYPTHRIKLWDLQKGERTATIELDKILLLGVAYSPSQPLLATGGSDGIVRLWNPQTAQLIAELKSEREIDPVIRASLAFSPDGKTLAVRTRHSLELWDVASRELIQSMISSGFGTANTSVVYSGDGRLLAVIRDKVIDILDARDGRLLHTLNGHTNGVLALAFSPDSKRLVSGGADKRVLLWDVEEALKLKDHPPASQSDR